MHLGGFGAIQKQFRFTNMDTSYLERYMNGVYEKDKLEKFHNELESDYGVNLNRRDGYHNDNPLPKFWWKMFKD